MDGRTNYYDHLRDARNEARYDDDPRSEPELGETKDALYFASDDYAGIEDDDA